MHLLKNVIQVFLKLLPAKINLLFLGVFVLYTSSSSNARDMLRRGRGGGLSILKILGEGCSKQMTFFLLTGLEQNALGGLEIV